MLATKNAESGSKSVQGLDSDSLYSNRPMFEKWAPTEEWVTRHPPLVGPGWGAWKSSCLFLIRKHSLGKSGPEHLAQILGSFPLIPYHLLNCLEFLRCFFTLYTNFVIWLPKTDWSKWPSLKLLEAEVFFFHCSMVRPFYWP